MLHSARQLRFSDLHPRKIADAPRASHIPPAFSLPKTPLRFSFNAPTHPNLIHLSNFPALAPAGCGIADLETAIP